jgi:enolase
MKNDVAANFWRQIFAATIRTGVSSPDRIRKLEQLLNVISDMVWDSEYNKKMPLVAKSSKAINSCK